jgi:RNA polymerase sigma-70 factor (ECF subfamily)
VDENEYEQVVNSFYESAYRFAFSLSRNADDASELTQETFARLLTKGGQICDHSKARAWLFTTLYRIFIGWKRRETNLPHFEISAVEQELPPVNPSTVDSLENETVLQALLELDEHYRVPLMLYYLDDHPYHEIAKLLDIPIGTVMSRLSRGKTLMRGALAAKAIGARDGIIPLDQSSNKKQA